MNKKIGISLIVPTFDRQNDIFLLFESILKNNIYPNEIIVVEQGDLYKTKERLLLFEGKLNFMIYKQFRKSSSRARNFWIRKSHFSLLLFLDDDVTLRESFFDWILNFFSENPTALWVTWKDLILRRRNMLSCLVGFFLPPWLYVLPTAQLIVNLNWWKRIISWLQWMPGCCLCFRWSVFQDKVFSFPDFMESYSYMEDIFFTYNLKATYWDVLYYDPRIEYEHNHSNSSRLPSWTFRKMEFWYHYIFWSRFLNKRLFVSHLLYFCGKIIKISWDVFTLALSRNFIFIPKYLGIQMRCFLMLTKAPNIKQIHKFIFN